MATLTVSGNSQIYSGYACSATVTYSVASTNTETTLTISAVTGYCRKSSGGIYIYPDEWEIYVKAGGNIVYTYNGETDTGYPSLPVKVTWTKSTSAQSKTLEIGIDRLSKSTTVSVPALASYTVSYNANGHGTKPSNQTKYYGKSLTLASAISATGFTFVRWNTKSDNTGTGYNGGASYTGNAALTLYAIWNHSVAYNANGGSGAPSTQTALATSAITLSSTKPTRTGYTFKSWNTKADGTGTTYNPSGTLAAAAAGVTLYAQWTIITYTVAYNANGHGTKPANQTKSYGVALTLADAISATGFTFVRWNTKADNTGTGYNAKASYTSNAALTLYAIWNHSVAYNANGGSGAPSTQTALATSAITISNTKPTRDGYRFVKWNTAAGGTGTDYNPGGTLAADAAGVTLYAQWEKVITAVTIGTIKAIRTQDASSTTEADEGTYAYVTVPVTVTGMAAANVSMTVSVVADSGSTPTITLIDASGTKNTDASFTKTLKFRASGCDVDVRYTFTVTVTANNTTATQAAVTASKSVVLASAFFTIDFKQGGKGVHFGGAATDDGFHVSMAAFFNKSLVVHYDTPVITVRGTISGRRDAAAVSAQTRIAGIQFRDSNNEIVGYIENSRLANNVTSLSFVNRRYISDGSSYFNHGVYLQIDNSGNPTVAFSNTESRDAWATGMNVVKRAGDTMTGVLTVQKNSDPYVATKHPDSAQIGVDVPSENIQMGRHIMLDSTGTSCGWITVYRNAADQLYTSIVSRRKNASGTMIQNELRIGINASGNLTVGVSSPEAWRNAIDAAPADTAAVGLSNYNSNIVSGTNSTTATRRHGIIVVRICFQLKAGTYPNNATEGTLFKVSPVPVTEARAVITAGSAAHSLRLLTSGACIFNNGVTLSGNTYLLGQIVYAY